jgi:Putative adhesin
MTKFAYIPAIAVLSVVTAATAASASERQETERVDRTVSIRAGGQLRVKNFSGRVTITAGSRSDVTVHAVRHAPRERLDHIKLEVRETDSGVSIEANKKDDDWRDRNNNVVDTELDIQVPSDVALDIEVFSSDLVVKDIRGRQRLHTFSGGIDVTGAEAALDAETFSGDITVSLVQGASASVDFDSFSGSLRTDAPMSYRTASRRHIRGDIGAGGTDYHFKTFSGDVRIR